jgi:hypothetical protein
LAPCCRIVITNILAHVSCDLYNVAVLFKGLRLQASEIGKERKIYIASKMEGKPRQHLSQ